MFLVQKANLPSPFRSTTAKSSHIPKPYQLDARLFDENLIHHLKTLDLPPDSSNISLSWLSAAVSFLSTVHSEAEVQVQIWNLKSDADDYRYQDLYMDYSLKVLDLCNLISSAVNRLTNRRILLNYSLRLLNFSDQIPPVEKLNKAKDALARSVNNISNSIPTEEKLKGLRAKALIEELAELLGNLPRGGGDLIRRTFYAIGILTVFIGSVLVGVLFGETDVDKLKLRVPAEFRWADSVNGVQDQIFDLVKTKENVILEVDDVERETAVVCDLIKAVVNGGDDAGVRVRLEAGVKEMTAVVKKLSDGMDSLTNGVNGIFRTVLKTRNGCLHM